LAGEELLEKEYVMVSAEKSARKMAVKRASVNKKWHLNAGFQRALFL
jgi:hypothetical protein